MGDQFMRRKTATAHSLQYLRRLLEEDLARQGRGDF
jgi:hypothetical protein